MYDMFLKMADGIGLIGVIALLIGYFMLNTGRWMAMSFIYQVFNFIGSALILFSLFFHWNLSAVVIEICWMAISLLGMYRCVNDTPTKTS